MMSEHTHMIVSIAKLVWLDSATIFYHLQDFGWVLRRTLLTVNTEVLIFQFNDKSPYLKYLYRTNKISFLFGDENFIEKKLQPNLFPKNNFVFSGNFRNCECYIFDPLHLGNSVCSRTSKRPLKQLNVGKMRHLVISKSTT